MKSFVSIIFAGVSNCQIIQPCFFVVYGSMNLGENIHTYTLVIYLGLLLAFTSLAPAVLQSHTAWWQSGHQNQICSHTLPSGGGDHQTQFWRCFASPPHLQLWNYCVISTMLDAGDIHEHRSSDYSPKRNPAPIPKILCLQLILRGSQKVNKRINTDEVFGLMMQKCFPSLSYFCFLFPCFEIGS